MVSQEEIDRMKAEAEANADNDKKEKEKIDKLNQADSVIFQTENQLKDLGDKIPADEKSKIEAALGKLKEAHKAQDIAGIDSAMEELNTIFQGLSAQMYSQQGSDAQQGASGAGQQTASGPTAGGNSSSDNSGEGDVKDADFEEV